MRSAALLGAALLLGAATGCGGGEESAVATLTAAPPPPTQSASPVSRIQKRLTRAGYYVVANPRPEGSLSLTTGVGRMIVYIVGFRSAKDAAGYAEQVAETAHRAPQHVVARRVGARVYSAVAAESPDATAAPEPLLEVIMAAEGAKARPIRISPR